MLKEFFNSPAGTGQIEQKESSLSLKAIISPHIDFHRGGSCFAYAYKEIAEAKPADVYIILGIAHIGGRGKYIGTKKDFETPLGIVKTDGDFIDKIAKYYCGDLFEDEFVHKSEHSIEFQVIFLQHIFNGKHNFTIVPILCSSFQDAIDENKSPYELEEVKSFVEAVKKTIQESGKRVCIISGSDLSHVGKRFGDEQKMTDEFLDDLEKKDLEMLKYVEDIDTEKFFANIEKDGDNRKVCGFSSIYTTMKILEGEGRGKLLKYEKSVDHKAESCVSFASLAYYEK
jgi:AmmeMemoRadiSam system protein B